MAKILGKWILGYSLQQGVEQAQANSLPELCSSELSIWHFLSSQTKLHKPNTNCLSFFGIIAQKVALSFFQIFDSFNEVIHLLWPHPSILIKKPWWNIWAKSLITVYSTTNANICYTLINDRGLTGKEVLLWIDMINNTNLEVLNVIYFYIIFGLF